MSGRKCAVYRYDCDVNMNEQGYIILLGDPVPAGAIITNALLVVDREPLSKGPRPRCSTIMLSLERPGDLLPECSISRPPWYIYPGGRRCIEIGRDNLPIESTGRNLSVLIGGADLLTGAFRVVLEYIELGGGGEK